MDCGMAQSLTEVSGFRLLPFFSPIILHVVDSDCATHGDKVASAALSITSLQPRQIWN